MNNIPNHAGPDTDASATNPTAPHPMVQAVADVKAMLAAGLIDPAALGLASRGTAPVADTEAVGVPLGTLVPGEPITVRDLVEKTLRGLKSETRRAYGSYLDLLANGWPRLEDWDGESERYEGLGERWAHEVLPTELEHALTVVQARAEESGRRRAAVREAVGRQPLECTGEGARYNAVGAWRRAFKVAVKDRHLARQFDPAQEIEKPRRLRGNRKPLTQQQSDQFWAVVTQTGNDPELDALIAETIVITGARREGLLNLVLGWVDREECRVKLDEKFDKKLWQPVPDWFAERLYQFAVSRGATKPTDNVFRTRPLPGRPSKPITSRRLDGLFQRVQSLLEWADKEQVTAHTLRHHAIALVERVSSAQVARRFARHAPGNTTDVYGEASGKEVAQAVIRVHGGDHPWLHRDAQ